MPLQTAIGVRYTHMVQKPRGITNGTFNTRESFHGRGARFLRSLRTAFLTMNSVAPVVFLAGRYLLEFTALLATAFVFQFLGLQDSCMEISITNADTAGVGPGRGVVQISYIGEPRYFFAEAQHLQHLYYQAVS